MKNEKRPEDLPQCPYCKAATPSYNEVGGLSRKPPLRGDVSICLMCSGLALFTGRGLVTRKPSAEEKHALLSDQKIISGLAYVNHVRRHHPE